MLSKSLYQNVALRKESVDRNLIVLSMHVSPHMVALRKESVDRNNMSLYTSAVISCVALRKESVDRNKPGTDTSAGQNRSLSARRAWIEIFCSHRP